MSFTDSGFVSLGPVVDSEACAKLLAEIRSRRAFKDLFMDADEFYKNPRRKGVNPIPGFNLLEDIDDSSVTDNFAIKDYLRAILGPVTAVLDAKIVAAIPSEWIPDWVKAEIENTPVPNLGAFVKPQYRDVTYFNGIDFHQDLIDLPDRPSDFVTLYVYLDEVTAEDSPLHVIPGSHKLGADVFPHNMERYPDPRLVLTGAAGSAYIWHACTLHGTQPARANRVSLRYVIAKMPGSSGCLDDVNEKLLGPLSLSATRNDLDATGAPTMRGNAINGT